MARTWTRTTPAASSVAKPQATTASGVEVITRFIRAYETMAQSIATTTRGSDRIWRQGRPARSPRARGARNGQEQERHRADQVQHRHRPVGAGIGHGLEPVAEPDHQLRPQHRRDEAARHDPGDRLRPEIARGGVGGGEAVEVVGGEIDADEQRRRQERDEALRDDRLGRHQPADAARGGADQEAGAPPPAAHDPGDHRRRQHRPHDGHADRQRRERLVLGQEPPGQPAEDEVHRHLGAENGLPPDEDRQVAPGLLVAGLPVVDLLVAGLPVAGLPVAALPLVCLAHGGGS